MIGWSGRFRSWLLRRREALHELAGDPDHDLARPEAGHLLGLLEGDRAVVDDGRDVGDGARRHVAQALPLPADAADRAVAVLADLEDEGLRELGPDVERGAGGERRRPRRVAGCGGGRPFSPPRSRPCGSPPAPPGGRRAAGPLPWAISGRPPPRPSMAGIASRTRSPADSPFADEVVADGHEQLRLVALEPERDHAGPDGPADVLRDALHLVDRRERAGVRDQRQARRDLLGARGELARLRNTATGRRPGLQPPARLAQLVLERPDPVRERLRRSGRRPPRPRPRARRCGPAGTRPRRRR